MFSTFIKSIHLVLCLSVSIVCLKGASEGRIDRPPQFSSEALLLPVLMGMTRPFHVHARSGLAWLMAESLARRADVPGGGGVVAKTFGREVLRGGVHRDAYKPDEQVAEMDPLGALTGRIVSRNAAHAQGLWHQTVHVYLFDQHGRILMQRRASAMPVSPGLLQIAVSGHIDAQWQKETTEETTLEAALQEGREEVGLRFVRKRLIRVSHPNEIQRSVGQNNEFSTIFFYRVTDEQIETIRANYDLGEVDELVLLPIEEFEREIDDHPERYAGSPLHLLTNYPHVWKEMKTRALGIARRRFPKKPLQTRA